ncbi:MFS transporter [Pseudonocardia humida]|uniref:MFS transporter n=1 Tax=Pseudonocardia humida TaxID=2800819 RepID=A0ABT1A0L9_9PSEU|nr:MFS transporter [Pseudonocardia humida]MCO1656429.1 MFS transporter [Pseudonocardia humida]
MSTNPSPQLDAADPLIHDPRRRRAVLVAVCIALMAVIASVNGLNVAQPQIALAFGASQSTVLWIINSYTLTLAALLLPLGAVGDRWGRRPVLLSGLVLFGLSNAAAGLAPTAEVMLGARVVSGAAAAMIMPITLAVITSTFPAEERSRGIGVWTAVAGGGGLLGMYLSALLVDVADWRWLFALPVVLVVAAVAMTLRSVPDSREVSGHGFDVVGSLTSALAVVALILVLHEGPEQGWTAPPTLLTLLVGVAAAVGFVAWELRRPAPLLDVRLFRDRGLASGSATILAVFGVQAGIFVVVYLYFQVVLGWSGLLSTLALLPMALLMMAASGLAPRLSARVGILATMAGGILLAGAGLALIAGTVSVDGGYPTVLPGMLAMGLGMGLAMTPSTEAITAALPRERQGIASALNDITREFGTALGVALLGAVLSAGYRGAIDPRLDGVPDDIADTARDGIANATAAADAAGPAAGPLLRTAQESFVHGWQQAMWAGVAVMAILFAYVVARGPRRPPTTAPTTGGRRAGDATTTP